MQKRLRLRMARWCGSDVYHGPEAKNDGSRALAVDRNGEVVVTGLSDNGFFADLETVAVDARGEVAVGESFGSGNRFDYYRPDDRLMVNDGENAGAWRVAATTGHLNVSAEGTIRTDLTFSL
jgi:hypothetical protein